MLILLIHEYYWYYIHGDIVVILYLYEYKVAPIAWYWLIRNFTSWSNHNVSHIAVYTEAFDKRILTALDDQLGVGWRIIWEDVNGCNGAHSREKPQILLKRAALKSKDGSNHVDGRILRGKIVTKVTVHNIGREVRER